MSELIDQYICPQCSAKFPRADLPECPMCPGSRLVELPQVGDIVKILSGVYHRHKGEFMGYTTKGRVLVRIRVGEQQKYKWVTINPKNLRVIRRAGSDNKP